MENGRCARHGGFNDDRPRSGTKFLAWKGLYSKVLNAEEANVFGLLKIGSLEQEIKLLRIQLLRALTAQEAWEMKREQLTVALKNDDGSVRTPDEVLEALQLESYEYKKQEGIDNRGQAVDQTEKKITHRKHDYKAEIRQLINLIAKLESQHHDLMKSDIPDSERINQIAEALRGFADSARASVPPKEE
jgi:chromosome segregation ATPase